MERVTLERVIDAWDEQVYGPSDEEISEVFRPILGQEGKLLSELLRENCFDDDCVAFLLTHFAPSDVMRRCADRSVKRTFEALLCENAPIHSNALVFMRKFTKDCPLGFHEARNAMIEMDAMARKLKAKNDESFSLAWGMNNIVNAAYLLRVNQCKDDISKNKLYSAIMKRCRDYSPKEFRPGIAPKHWAEWSAQRAEIVEGLVISEGNQNKGDKQNGL